MLVITKGQLFTHWQHEPHCCSDLAVYSRALICLCIVKLEAQKKCVTKPQPTSFMADTLTTEPLRWIMEKAIGFVVKALCIHTEIQPPCPPQAPQLGQLLRVNADGSDAQQWKTGNKLA